ncbi:MAG: ribosome biogenesis GTPase Der [Flavobacteriales bacterium AspAUS03]
MGHIVAIIGRPNVGKSTFFNRLLGRREAIVDAVSGVTRDRHYGTSDWNGVTFSVIDTGGYITGTDDVFETEIRKQAIFAMEEADVIIFVVDVVSGVTDIDREIAQILRVSKKEIFLMVNKVDNNKYVHHAVEFFQLGLSTYHCVSAANGSGTGELLDQIVAAFPKAPAQDHTVEDLARLAVVGRPNVGKSTLINTLLGKNRHIVTNIAGTTRDTMDVYYRQFGFECILIDTAGIRKKSKVEEDLEFYAVMRAVRAIEHADVCLLMIDATRGFESQDMNIFRLVEKNNKGLLILVNKWDLVEKETYTAQRYEAFIKQKIGPFEDVPILFTSAQSKKGLLKMMEIAIRVVENRRRKLKTSVLNELMLPIIQTSPPPVVKGKYIKVKYCTQLPTYTPQFAFFTNLPQYVKVPYKRFIENQLRHHFDFKGVPINVYFRKK